MRYMRLCVRLWKYAGWFSIYCRLFLRMIDRFNIQILDRWQQKGPMWTAWPRDRLPRGAYINDAARAEINGVSQGPRNEYSPDVSQRNSDARFIFH